MKKQFLNLGKALNKAEQRSIIGGLPGTCAVMLYGYGGPVFENISKNTALKAIAANGGRYCCDSCEEASWL